MLRAGKIGRTAFCVVVTAAVMGFLSFCWCFSPPPEGPIRIGALYSCARTMAVSEKPLIDAVRLAIEAIDNRGGLLRRKVEMVVARAAEAPFPPDAPRHAGSGNESAR